MKPGSKSPTRNWQRCSWRKRRSTGIGITPLVPSDLFNLLLPSSQLDEAQPPAAVRVQSPTPPRLLHHRPLARRQHQSQRQHQQQPRRVLRFVDLTLLPVKPRALVIPERLLGPQPLAVDAAVPQTGWLIRQQQPRFLPAPFPGGYHVGATPARLLEHLGLPQPALAHFLGQRA